MKLTLKQIVEWHLENAELSEINSDQSTMMKLSLVKSGYPSITKMKHYCESFFEDTEQD